ncbi:MAG: transcriptional regulator PpsR [Xanthomonadaceae bacterium]|nr:transcriptional regulator PpsR [Xanthomonadaceae bacterium]
MSAPAADETGKLGALSSLAPELAEMLVSIASDIALVVDDQGVIQRIALGGGEPVKTMADDWVGRRFADTVTADTRRKVEQLLADVAATGLSRARQVNHPSPLGLDVPVAYSAVRLGLGGPLLVVGRDMSVVSAMQQRLLHAQAEMEREYWQRRQSETRYQLLFQIATDPVLVVDAGSLNVIDANRAAARLFGQPLEQLIGKRATLPLHDSSRAAVLELFATAKANGRAVDCEALIEAPQRRVRISVTPLRTESSTALLMRLKTVDPQWQVPEANHRLVALMGLSPDAIVITDGEGRVQMANPAFIELAQIDARTAVVGGLLSNWLGATAAELDRLMKTMREALISQRLTTSVRGAAGRLTTVEVSAVCLSENDEEAFGFIVRPAYVIRAGQTSGDERLDPSIH